MPKIDIGTATLGMMVALTLRRNRNTTTVTSITASTSVSSVSCSEARIVVLRSIATRDVHVGRHGRFQVRQLRLHGVDGLDDVGVRLTVENDQHRRLTFGHAEIAIVLNGVGDLGDVGEADRRAVAISDHQRRVVGGNVRLVIGVDLKTPVAVVDRALRAVGVGRGKRGAHVLEPDAVIV